VVVLLSPCPFVGFLLSSMRAFVRSAQRSNQLRWHISRERKSEAGRGCPFTSLQWNGQPFGTHRRSIKVVSCVQSTQVVWAEAEVLMANKQQHAATRMYGRRWLILSAAAVVGCGLRVGGPNLRERGTARGSGTRSDRASYLRPRPTATPNHQANESRPEQHERGGFGNWHSHTRPHAVDTLNQIVTIARETVWAAARQ